MKRCDEEAASVSNFSALVLLRVAAAPKGREPLGATVRALRPFLAKDLPAREARDRIETALDDLVREGLLARPTAGAHAPTATTRAALARALGVEARPPDGAWPRLLATAVAARALGLPAPDAAAARRLRTVGGLRAAILTRAFALPLPPFPPLPEVGPALAWRRLALRLGRPLPDAVAPNAGRGPVVAVLVQDWLGGGRPRPVERSLAMLAARAVGATQTEPAALRRALVARWLREGPLPAGHALAGTAGASPPPSPPADDLRAFAAEVRELAGRIKTGRFGPDCVFISDAFDAYRERYATADLALFRRRLIEAGTRGWLELQRADLVEALDPERLRKSETPHLGTRFHFVRVTP